MREIDRYIQQYNQLAEIAAEARFPTRAFAAGMADMDVTAAAIIHKHTVQMLSDLCEAANQMEHRLTLGSSLNLWFRKE